MHRPFEGNILSQFGLFPIQLQALPEPIMTSWKERGNFIRDVLFGLVQVLGVQYLLAPGDNMFFFFV